MRRAIQIGAALVGAFAAFMVLVHLPAVQRVMGWRNERGEVICPVGFAAPRTSLASLMTAPPPRAVPSGPRPALGFALDAMTRGQVDAWAAQHDLRCTERRGGAQLECLDVPARALGDRDGLAATAWFEFDRGGALTAVRASRRTDDAAPVAAAFRTTERALTAEVGAPSASSGDAATLTAGAFHQAMVEHRGHGYRAVVRATNLGDGYVLTESYVATR